ncbi:MAG: hypothetical protein EB079_05475 [Verrucomicrobia bacterium]|nr:hypothetical protein [Verrucomicrobiota bacterium]
MKNPLGEILAGQIRKQGPLPFDHFMSEALYHPEHGFYSSGRARTGIKGDFLTPVSPGPVLGNLLARQADELHRILGRPARFRLIEQGADTGALARDLLGSLRGGFPELAAAVEFHFLEPLPKLAQKQKHTLGPLQRQHAVHWHASWDSLSAGDLPGLFYSCELLDSFPVRIFRHCSGRWLERVVGWDPPRFVWQEREALAPELQSVLGRTPAPAEDHVVEIRPGATEWMRAVAQSLSHGLILTMDYGFPAAGIFEVPRPAGTLMAFREHRQRSDPLADPGEQDLTCHVNFGELEELGSRLGLQNHGLTDFARGLTALAAPLLQQPPAPPEPWIRNFRHLTHPSFFGHTHKILAQGKNLPHGFHPAILGSTR